MFIKINFDNKMSLDQAFLCKLGLWFMWFILVLVPSLFSLSKMPGIPNYFDFVYLGMLRMNLMFNFRKVLKWAKFFSWVVIVVGAGAVAGAVVLSSISSSRVFLFFEVWVVSSERLMVEWNWSVDMRLTVVTTTQDG